MLAHTLVLEPMEEELTYLLILLSLLTVSVFGLLILDYILLYVFFSLLHIDPPSIITAPDGVEAVYEEMVELSCTAEGLPMPTIMWQVEPYGGGLAVDIMIPTSITQEGNTTHTSVLTLLRVSPNDTANYTCTASNRLGSETESAYVEVLGKM